MNAINRPDIQIDLLQAQYGERFQSAAVINTIGDIAVQPVVEGGWMMVYYTTEGPNGGTPNREFIDPLTTRFFRNETGQITPVGGEELLRLEQAAQRAETIVGRMATLDIGLSRMGHELVWISVSRSRRGAIGNDELLESSEALRPIANKVNDRQRAAQERMYRARHELANFKARHEPTRLRQ